eukprot:6211831-Pleurochrysis_carterae.AAC.2
MHANLSSFAMSTALRGAGSDRIAGAMEPEQCRQRGCGRRPEHGQAALARRAPSQRSGQLNICARSPRRKLMASGVYSCIRQPRGACSRHLRLHS